MAQRGLGMIRQRPDCQFQILTKRIETVSRLPCRRIGGDGYDNVLLGCTCENQEAVDTRLPLFLSYPIKHRFLACAPLLEDLKLGPCLSGISMVSAGGETSREARVCQYEWVLHFGSNAGRPAYPSGLKIRDPGSLKMVFCTKSTPDCSTAWRGKWS